MHKTGLVNVVIVGGGPVGSVLALALQQQQVPFTMLEARAKGASHLDTRALALSYGGKLILEKLGVWDAVSARATAINTIHISQRGGLGRTKLNAAEHGLPSLGYVLPYGALMQALDAVLDASSIIYEAEATEIKSTQDISSVIFKHANIVLTLKTSLTVVADGGRSLGEIEGLKKETKEYGHDALVTKVRAELPHNHVAYERFTPTGPMALLPNGEVGFSLVWTGLQANIHGLLALDDESFLAQLHQAFGDRVGKFLSVENRMSFPLKLSTLKPSVAPHLAVIGNAAQTMHPVAGQGFNVGMRDAWALAGLIINAAQSELGGADMLANYTQLRSRDTRGGILFTDLLVNMFNNDLIGLQAMRGAGLGLLELIKPAKSLLVSKMSFGK
ncbi:MAG TPA: FAD-dependent monooxygenase [Methylotenera sp.]|nr:FAD-dependent monooxygenase [Methylotenera sp.]